MAALLRSVLAVVTGFVLIGALAYGTGLLLQRAMPAAFDATGNPTTMPLLLLTTVYVGVYATAGCWLAARLAPSHPMRHALVLGLLGLALNVASSVAIRGTVPDWYLGLNLALTMVWAWLGGWLRERELARRHAAPALAR
jgi:hypothetical protein